MIGMEILKWWYTAGWRGCGAWVLERLKGVMSFFSIGTLIRTLFAPFRQIAAGETEGVSKMQIFLDKLVSRLVGCVVRLFLMIGGVVAGALWILIGAGIFLAWGILPIVPAGSIVLAIMGVGL